MSVSKLKVHFDILLIMPEFIAFSQLYFAISQKIANFVRSKQRSYKIKDK